jgi:hypothetical protein
LLKERNSPEVAFTEGFQWAFWVGFGIWTAAFLAALVFIRREEVSADAAEMAMG